MPRELESGLHERHFACVPQVFLDFSISIWTTGQWRAHCYEGVLLPKCDPDFKSTLKNIMEPPESAAQQWNKANT